MSPPPATLAVDLAAPPGRTRCASIELPPTEQLLVDGGDARVALDRSGLNKYGCQPFPDPALAAFGSSTASVISDSGFAAADALRGRLVHAAGNERPHVTYARELQRIRGELLHLCGLSAGPGVDVVFAASGTDLHLLAAQLAAAPGEFLCAVMVEATETGSGVPVALAGQHFSAWTALGERVISGASIVGGCGVDVIAVPSRGANGAQRAAADVAREVESAADAAVARGKRVLLTVVDVSKTGLLSPSLECVLALQRRLGAAVDILVDACQFRLTPATLRAYLDHGFMVAVTGSKFLTGPAFAGGLLVPDAVARRLRDRTVPRSLGSYSTRAEWPRGWAASRMLPEAANYGLLLRWEATLAELRAFRALPEEDVSGLVSEFALAVQARLRGDVAFEALATPVLDRSALVAPTGWDHLPTIFPFVLRRASGGALSRAETEQVYKSLGTEIAVPGDTAAVGRLRCQIGQPVACGLRAGVPVSALRLCLSARLIGQAIREHRPIIDEALAVLDKTALLVRTLTN